LPSRPVPGTTEPGKFGRLFAEARPALLAGTHQLQFAPADNGPRWGISAVLRPDPRAARAIEQIAVTAAGVVGDGHWVAGAAASSHLTLRGGLERYRTSVPVGDPLVARYAAALRTAAGGIGPIRFAVTGRARAKGFPAGPPPAGQAGSGAGRRASRIPRWLVEVSMAWAMRAAGR
jgi:hypothetical protein